MTEDRWEQIIGRIKDEFEVLSCKTIEGESEDETVEEIIFLNSLGKMKILKTKKPRVLEEKTFYSNRIGGETKIERVYSKDDFVLIVQFFVENNGEWVPVDNSSFM